MTVQIEYQRRTSNLLRSTGFVRRFFIFMAVGAAELLMAFAVLGMAIGGFLQRLGYVIPFAFIMAVVLAGYAGRAVRRRRAFAVLSYVDQAVRLNLPLPRVLLAAQASEGGKLAQRLGNLRELLFHGASLGQAMEAAVPELSPRAAALIGVAERSGRLPETLDRLLAEDRQSDDQPRDGRLAFVYVATLFLVAVSIVTLISIFVLPKFEAIFRDFHISLPPIALLGRWFNNDDVLLSSLVFGACWLTATILVGRSAGDIFFIRRQRSTGWIAATRDRILWLIPGLRALARDRRLSDICLHLSGALAAGGPLTQALDDCLYLNNGVVLEKKILAWRDGLNRGLAPHEAAKGAGLPSMLVGLMATAEPAGNMPEAFAFLGRYYASRFSRLIIFLQGALLPVGTLIMAAVVLLVALSIIEPVRILIETVANHYPGAAI